MTSTGVVVSNSILPNLPVPKTRIEFYPRPFPPRSRFMDVVCLGLLGLSVPGPFVSHVLIYFFPQLEFPIPGMTLSDPGLPDWKFSPSSQPQAGVGGANFSLVELGKQLLAASRDGDTSEVAQLVSRGAPFTTDVRYSSPARHPGGKCRRAGRRRSIHIVPDRR